MTTQLTPPPVSPPEPTVPPTQSEGARMGTRALAVTIAILGAVALVIGGVATAFRTVREATSPAPVSQSITSVTGVEGVDIDVSAGDLRIEFGGSDVTLVSTGESGWTLARDGDQIVITSPDDGLDFGFDWLWRDAERSATLTLPSSLEGTDLDIELSAGRVLADGAFGEAEFTMSAGSLELEGSARTVEGQVSAGHAILELADVREAGIELAAGHLQGTFTGEAPSRVELDVSAGSIDLTLPDVAYAVIDDSDAGDLDLNNLQQRPDASHRIQVGVTAGKVDLRAGD